MPDLDKEKAIATLNRILEQELAGVVRYTHYSLHGVRLRPHPDRLVAAARRRPSRSLHAQAGGRDDHPRSAATRRSPSARCSTPTSTDIGSILRESLETEGEALALYRELLDARRGTRR